jgi:glycosyltransferase involved in cell wall biosynthesis
MKTLFLSSSDLSGGAARAAHWLARGLVNNGEELSVCVQEKTGTNPRVWQVKKSNAGKFLDMIRPHLDVLPLSFYPLRKKGPWSLNWMPNSKLRSAICELNPDIINLHWVGGGFVPISLLSLINKPIVWSLYDMWPFTGGCHYDNSCGKFVDSCGSCPQLISGHRDLSSRIHAKKMKYWQDIPMTIVAPSSWLAEEARKSSLFKNLRVEVIPHGTDLNVYSPLNKDYAKEILGLQKSRRYVLFGAGSGIGDTRKGYQYLQPALEILRAMGGFEDVSLLIFGEDEPIDPPKLGFPVHYVGRLHDDISLSVLYSAADVTVTPSMQEAFGMTASESMACGTPVVAFGASGPLDVIDPKIDGYLARPYEIGDLAYGLSWILDSTRSETLSRACRIKCELKFDLIKVSRQYSRLYQELIEGSK